MSKHAATGRRNQTGATLRRRDGDAVGRHRARPSRWGALVRSARRALLGRSGRASVFTRFGRWAGFGASTASGSSSLSGWEPKPGSPPQRAIAGPRSIVGLRSIVGPRAIAGRWAVVGHGAGGRLWTEDRRRRPGVSALGSVLALSALAGFPKAGVLRRSSAALRRSAARASCRVRELSVQWAVQAKTRADAGMSTAEYAVGTIAACAFAALLWKVVTSGEVRSMLAALIQKALKLAA
ncbi:DUF4244 domain-containing protein [Microbispora bryophytorum]|uniref:DUF4244 domain-containing protein n=1 Tax=Microbispora bryophytorum TaxID=1460882 RepID=UPI0033E40044